MTQANKILLSLVVALVVFMARHPTPPGPGPVPPGPVVVATAATYVYDYPKWVVPPPVAAALGRLNKEKKIRATPFEADTIDGTGATPDQYKVPLEAARKAGLPALVVTAGDTVLKVVSCPITEEAVLEAVP